VRQNRRFAGTDLTCNADMRPAEIREYRILPADGQSLIRSAMRQMHLSAGRGCWICKRKCNHPDESDPSGWLCP